MASDSSDVFPFPVDWADDVDPEWLPALEAAEDDLAAGRVIRVKGDEAFTQTLDEKATHRQAS